MDTTTLNRKQQRRIPDAVASSRRTGNLTISRVETSLLGSRCLSCDSDQARISAASGAAE